MYVDEIRCNPAVINCMMYGKNGGLGDNLQ